MGRRRHRRIPQLPQQRRLQGQGDALPKADGLRHQARREDQGADALGHTGQ